MNELKLLRGKAGLTLREAHSATGIDHGLISNYENGKVKPGIKNYLKLTNLYNAKINEANDAQNSL